MLKKKKTEGVEIEVDEKTGVTNLQVMIMSALFLYSVYKIAILDIIGLPNSIIVNVLVNFMNISEIPSELKYLLNFLRYWEINDEKIICWIIK